MQYRADVSDHLIHFIKGDTDDAAFAVLMRILEEKQLCASNNLIKGGHAVVCFTESPLWLIGQTLVESHYRCRPFGVRVPKRWLFERGGRPVIYQEDGEYDDLPLTHRWRHVRYEPHADPPVDFSWEREWRIQRDIVPLDPVMTSVIVPNRDWDHHISQVWEYMQDRAVEDYGQEMNAMLAELSRETFPWTVTMIAVPP